MTSEPNNPMRRRQIEALFDRAIELAPPDRVDFLVSVGETDPELRREVEALLAAAEQSGVTESLARFVVRSMEPAEAPVPPAVSPYEIVEQIGGGGMGVVYKARDPQLQRFVALKFLPTPLSSDPELKRRFLQEAMTIAALDHPNLCTIIQVAEEGGQLVIVMPYYQGETLKERIARGPLPVAEVLDVALQVADGLAHAHAAGVVHRDIKPANIVTTPGGRIKILDFGIAKVARANANLTRTGAVIGTLSYMSPEQACGDPVDHRADLWALGAVLYEMLAGRPPFVAESMEALFFAIQSRPPERLVAHRPDVPPALASIVHRLLEKEPARRYEDAGILATDLESVRAGGPAANAAVLAPGRLERARQAFARAAWREAYEGLAELDTGGELDAHDLDRLAEAAWWLSEATVCIRARERAYRQHLERDDRRAAAAVALALAEDHFHRLARSVGQGWLRRAERHLDGLPEDIEQGWLHRLRFVIAMDASGKADEALEWAGRALEIARRVGDIDLETLALQDRGRALVAVGRVREGMALIDEAMISVTAGEVSPRIAGRAYCNMLNLCERLGDFGRAAEWNDLTDAWCEPVADSGYPGICRVRRAGLFRLRGALREAEHEAQRAANELDDFLTDVAGEAFYELGETRRRVGDVQGADNMFREAHARGRDPQPGLALLRLTQGKVDTARSMIERACLESGPSALDRAKLLPALVEIRVASGDLASARAAALELDGITETYTSHAFRAAAAIAHGRVELAGGQAEQAIPHLRRAGRIWREINLPLELAQTQLLLARAYSALGNTDEAELEEQAARATIERILAQAHEG